MNKPSVRVSLGAQLLLAAFLSLALAGAFFWGLRAAAWSILDSVVESPSFVSKRELAAVSQLQRYLSTNSVALVDRDALDQWAGKNDLFLLIYRDGVRGYSSVDYYFDPAEDDPELQGLRVYPVELADGPAQAVVSCYSQYRLYSLANAFCVVPATLLLVVSLLLPIRRKTRYIALLERELKVLEGGDLNYPVTVRGTDELSSLAAGIDAMRCAIVEKQQMEEEAREANRALITAMSHDLRTPLTSLIGYLEILSRGQYRSGEELERFIEAGKSKAYRLKELSDRLFEYFLVYGRDREELMLAEAEGSELIGQLVEEGLFDLESEGFSITRRMENPCCRLDVDIGLLRRVFGNLFSNLAKYADHSAPIRVSCRCAQGELLILFENRVLTDGTRAESTGIGLKTCEEILRRHGGSFCCRAEGGNFLMELRLPARVSRGQGGDGERPHDSLKKR